METKTEKDTCIPVFTAALFTIARTWKQPRCPSTDEWVKKLWYIYTMEYSCCRSVVSDSLQPRGLQPTRLLHPWDFPGKSTGVGCHFLFQGIFPIQGSNSGLPHCRQRNTFESVLMRWMNLESIIQSEVSQKKKDKYHILIHIYRI